MGLTLAIGAFAALADSATAASGEIDYRGCFSADTDVPAGSNGCVFADVALSDGENTGFDDLIAADISPDGRSLYAVSEEDAAIVRFDRAADGALTYRDCFTADSSVGAGANDCSAATTSSPGGADTGLQGLRAVAVSPGGESVYAVARSDASIVRFDRAPDGALTYRGCFTADSGIAAGTNNCSLAATTGPDGAETGFAQPRSVAVSPDGASVYVVSQDDASIIRFDRAPGGALTYRDCFTADSAIPAAANGCATATSTAVDGANTGFHDLISVAASRDGRSVYAVSNDDAAVLRFDRAAGGSLSYRDCFTADSGIPPGRNACVAAPTRTPEGENSGFSEPFAVDLSPDGASLYASTNDDASIVRFDRAADGALTYRDCFTADSDIAAGTNGCSLAATTAPRGENTGLEELRSLDVSPDNVSVYAIANDDGAVVRFDRAPSGALIYRDCFTSDSDIAAGVNNCSFAPTTSSFGQNTGIDALMNVDVSPDGRSVYLISEFDAAVLSFDREPVAAPILSFGAQRKQASKRRILADASCDVACAVEVTGTLRVPVVRGKRKGRAGPAAARPRKFRLGPVKVEIPAGGGRAVTVVLRKRARKAVGKALRSRKRVRATLTAVATGALGDVTPPRRAKVILKRRGKRKG